MRKFGSPVAALTAALLLASCGGGASESADQPSEPPKPNEKITSIDQPGSVGLDIRYLDKSGTIKTLPVEDFNR